MQAFTRLRHILLPLLMCYTSIAFSARAAQLPGSLDNALKELDQAIEQRDKYFSVKQGRIDSLKTRAASMQPVNRIKLMRQIGDEYHHFNVDSALKYYHSGAQLAQQLNRTSEEQQFRLLWASLLPIKGAVFEAIATFDSIPAQDVFPENQTLRYKVGNQLFFYLAGNYPIRESQNRFARRAMLYTDSLVSLLPAGGDDTRFFEAELYFMNGERQLAVAILSELLEKLPNDSRLFAHTASILADYYSGSNHPEDALFYKAVAAAADIRSATREETALHSAGVMLYDRGDLDRAYAYVINSLSNAVSSGAAVRAMQTAESLPIIGQSFRKSDKRKVTFLMWLIVVLVVALGSILAMMFYVKKEMRKLQSMKVQLNVANRMKESFISQFLSLCSIYMEKLEEFNRLASRKIKAGQVEDLYQLLKSGKMVEEQNLLFCEIFDNAFVHIYPTFVEEVNRLLESDKQFTLTQPNKLNTELRILAFMRLGVDDSSQISRFLGLSLNTIYTYRNKIKSKARRRDTFERDIMQIAQIS